MFFGIYFWMCSEFSSQKVAQVKRVVLCFLTLQLTNGQCAPSLPAFRIFICNEKVNQVTVSNNGRKPEVSMNDAA